jgi:hypothetical protein
MKADSFTKHLTFFYGFAALLLAVGVFGIALGLYVYFIRGGSRGELILNNSLTFYSIGLVFSAIIHFQAFNTIKVITKKRP